MDNTNSNLPPDWLKELSPMSQAPPPSGFRHTSVSASPSPPLTAVERTTTQRLTDCLSFGHKTLGKKPLVKDSVVMWFRRVRAALLPAFGAQSPLCKSLEAELKTAVQSGLSTAQFAQKLEYLETLTFHIEAIGSAPLCNSASEPSRPPVTKNIFIIHGHDELNTRRLETLLQAEFRLSPILMRAKPGMTRPLVEKFEDHARTCSFAFALFTPDDQVQNPRAPYSQARPNVIYEAGWFVGRLGKERVTLLLRAGTEIHSDLHGVSQIRFDDNVEDKFLEIQRELQAAGMVH